MKLLLAFLTFCTLAAAQPAPTSYQLLPAALTWTGYAEVGTYAPSGTVQLRGGRFLYDGRTLRQARLEVDMRTIAQEQAQLAEHLRGEDFFDVAKYPTAVFVLRQFGQGQASGQLTLRGITRPVQFPLTLERLPDGSLRGTATLDRTQFGIHHNSSSFFQNLGSYAIRNEFRLVFDVLAEAAQ